MSDLAKQLIEKTSYINDVKQAIKRSIEDKGQTIEDDLSFYNYSDKIRQITTSEGMVKLFETEEEMQADNTAKENDLAVVYRKEVKNMTVADKPQYLTFPETVTLPQEITSNYVCVFRSDSDTIIRDIQISLNHSIFRLNCWGSNVNFQVQYRSTDGINYTRDRFESGDGQTLTNPVDLTVPIKVYYEEEWDDNIGYFMQIDGMNFDGLFEYGEYIDKNYLHFWSLDGVSFDIENGSIVNEVFDKTFIEKKIDIQKLSTLLTKFRKEVTPYSYSFVKIYLDSSDNICLIMNSSINQTVSTFVYNESKEFLGLTTPNQDYSGSVNIYHLNLENQTYSLVSTINPSGECYYSDGVRHYYNVDIKSFGIECYVSESMSRPQANTCSIWVSSTSAFIDNIAFNEDTCYDKYNEYQIAPSQLTLTSSNQLLPDVKAYGKNGNITGDSSIYNNLDLSQLFTANGMDIYRDGLVALKESSTGNKIKDVEPFTDGVGFITSNNTIGELFKNYQVIRSKSYIIAYDDTTINLYDLNYNLLQTGTNSRIKELFLTSKLIYEDADRVVHIGFSNNSYDGYCFLVDLSEDGIKITYVSLDYERIDLICYVGEDKEHNGYKYYVVSRNSFSSSSVRIEAFTTTDSGVGYTKRISNVSLTNKTDNDTSYCCFDDNYVYMTLPPYWRKFIVIDKSTDTIIKNNTSESSIYLCNNVGTCYMNTGGDTNSGVYKLKGTSQEKISENKNIPTISTGLYQYYYVPDYDCIITTMSGGDEVALSTSQGLNEICNFRSLLQPYYNGDMNKGGLNTTLYLNGTKLEGLAVLFPDYTDTNAKVFNISVDFTKTLSNEGDINTLPINNGYIGNLVISQMNNTNYNNTLTPEEYLQALQTAKEIKGNK